MPTHPCIALTLQAALALLAPVSSLHAQPRAATPMVSVEQAGRTVAPSGDKLRLQREAFTLVLRLPHKTLATVHAAQRPDAFDLAKSGKPLDAVYVSENTLAMSSGNPSRTLFLSDDAASRFHAWYFESERDHSFDSATVQGDTILARFTVAELALPAPAHYPIARFPGRELYLVVRVVDEKTNREVRRQALALTFDDLPAGAGSPRARPSREGAGLERDASPAASPSAQHMDPPRRLKHVEPVYPEKARQARIQGVVIIEATVGVDGKVRRPQVVQSIPMLDEAALAAVRQWEYAPAIVAGKPTAVATMVTVDFALSQPSPPSATAALPGKAAETALLLTMQHSFEQVMARRDLSRDAVRALIAEGMGAADALRARPNLDYTDFRLATMGRGMGFELQAERLAETREQRIALLIESERWSDSVDKFKDGVPPPAPTRSSAEIVDMEWRAISRWHTRIAYDGQPDEAIAGFSKYVTENPRIPRAHASFAEFLIDAVKYAPNTAARTSRLEQAAKHLQRALDLAPTATDRDDAFERLLRLYGPDELNRPGEQEAVARAVVKRQPAAPAGHYALAVVLLRTGKSKEAENVLQGARAAFTPTASTRGAMARELLKRIGHELPPAAGRRLFDEATALLLEAEKLDANALEVIEGRLSWLFMSANRFEKDPARKAAQLEQADRLAERARQMRSPKSD